MGTVTGAGLVTRALEANGVEYFFNVAGNGIFPLIEAVHRSELRYVSGVNETAVALVAEGYARATRGPAVLNLYHSSGTALAMVGLTVAWADNTPLVVTTTTNSRRLSRQDQYAAVPRSIVEATEQYTKWGFEVPTAERVPDAIDRAITIASAPPMGPVHLAFPMDLYEEPVDEEALDRRRGRTETRAKSTADGLREVAPLLAEAETPLLLAGSAIGQHGAVEAAVDLAETLGAGVVTEAKRSYLPFPTDHPLYAGDVGARGDLVGEADVVLAVGFEFTELAVDQLPLRNTDSVVVQLTTDPVEVGKQRVPDYALVGHPEPTMAALADRLRGRVDEGTKRRRRDTIAEYARRTEAEQAERRELLSVEGSPTAMEAVVRALPEVFGDDLVLVDHAVSAGPYLRLLDFDAPDQYYAISGKASAQGWGMPAAVGVQLGHPEKHVVAVVGDGGFMFTGPGPLYTALRHDVPVTVVVANDRGWGGGGYDFWVEGGDEGDLFLGGFADHPIDFRAMCEGMSVHSARVADPDEAEGALVAARENDGPSVVEVMVDPEGVRRYYRER